MTTFGRLDYLTRVGWVVGHAGWNLVNPEKYVAGLEKREVFGRFVEIGDDYQPTGYVAVSPNAPKFSLAPQGKVPITTVKECAACGDEHRRAWECLI